MNKDTAAGDWSQHWALSSKHDLGLDRVPVEAYTSPQVFEAEREKIFRKVWLCVGRESEAPNTGDFVKREIHPLQTEALIVRGKDGKLRAFYNTCRHRGSALVSPCEGTTNAFVCPYHAWTYGTDGALRSMPGAEYFPQVDRAKTGLKPIHLDVWNGFYFLNFDEQPEQTLTEYLGEFGKLFGDVPFDNCPHAFEMNLTVDANWKTMVEASNEGYHVAVLHRWTVSAQGLTSENPLGMFFDPIFSPPHFVSTVEANHRWRPKHPVLQFVYDTAAFRAQPGGEQTDPTSFVAHKAINRVGVPALGVENITLFPFTVFQILNDRYIWFQYWPVSENKTHFVFRGYTRTAPENYREAFAAAHMTAFTRDIVAEDSTMTSTQQKSFASGAITEVFLGENEPLLRYFHTMVQQYLSKGEQAK